MPTFNSRKASLLLKEGGVKAVIDYCYSIDSDLYSCSKQTEGQYSYLKYIEKMRRIIRYTFDEVLPDYKEPLRSSLRNHVADSRKLRNKASIVVLNNTSLLGHVSVLCSMSLALNNELGPSSLFVICLFAKGKYSEWKQKLSNAGLQVLPLRELSLYGRLLECERILRPAQYIWWGWPPGQWLGPLICPWAKHRSVSFKYDIPSAEYFTSHHIGYGKDYAEKISDQIQIQGFHQPISVKSIPGLSDAMLRKTISVRRDDLQQFPLSKRKTIQIGTLAREEKVAQPDFLLLVVQILKADKRLKFNWTGREKNSFVISTFDKHGLSKQQQFHGWVQSVEFLPKLDIYLDTFPYGTGEAFVTAGYFGMPIATLASPYEAHFSNILTDELRNILVRKSSTDYGEWVLEVARGLREVPDSWLVQKYFLECFNDAKLDCLSTQLSL